MKLSAVPLVLAGASLAIQASAAPMRIVVVSSHQEVSAAGGHSNADANVVAAMPGPVLASGVGAMRVDHQSMHSKEMIKAHHCGGSIRETFSAFVGKVFGFPGANTIHIRPTPLHPDQESGRVSILPWFGTPDNFTDRKGVEDGPRRGRPMTPATPVETQNPQEDVGPVRIVHMSGPEDRPRRFRHRHGPFLRRMHFALMALGPWEGRAVAFVLGCGIGVLLRMMWVMGVVLVRAVSGRKNDEDSHEAEAVFDADAEEILVAPPQYTPYPDEKAAVANDDKPQTE